MAALALQSCDYQPSVIGPPGQPGVAFFGITYETAHPYSYWDNNPNMPYNPEIDVYYPTAPGLYEFEYYINPSEFWFGTYQVWINPGEPGGSYGRPGRNGLNTYLLLVCDPDGYWEYREDAYGKQDGNTVVIERKEGEYNYRITLQKGDPKIHKTHEPKYLRKDIEG